MEGQSLSSKSISVTWDEVPEADQNGIITSYNISYHSLMENHRNSTAVDYPGRQVNLTGLKEFVNYSITVFASTKIGDGPASDPVYVKTAEDSEYFLFVIGLLLLNLIVETCSLTNSFLKNFGKINLNTRAAERSVSHEKTNIDANKITFEIS